MTKTTAALWAHGASVEFTLPERVVDTVFLHCSASDKESHDDVSVMDDWHKKRGWSGVGYHLFVRKNGDIQAGRDLESRPAAQKGHNKGSIAICLHGLKKDAFTQAQFESLIALCTAIDAGKAPARIRFRGHCEVSSKSCPVFDYKTVLGLDDAGQMTRTTSSQPGEAVSTGAEPAPAGFLDLFQQGAAVRSLQQMLRSYPYAAGLLSSGLYDQETLLAVSNLQCRLGVKEDGVFGPKTQSALHRKAAQELRAARQLLKDGSRGDAVRALQVLLHASGHELTADGAFGPRTKMAVSAFQRQNRLSVDGKVGAKTIAALTAAH